MSEVLQNKETWPVIDREQLLKDSQNREFARLSSFFETDVFTPIDSENILINLWNKHPQTIPYILEYKANFNAWIERFLVGVSANNENQVNQTEKVMELENKIAVVLREKLEKLWVSTELIKQISENADKFKKVFLKLIYIYLNEKFEKQEHF